MNKRPKVCQKRLLMPLRVFLIFGSFGVFFSENCRAGDIRDVKAPVGFPLNGWMLFSIFVILCAAGILGWVYFLKFKKRAQKPAVFVTKEPWEIALEELEALKKQDLPVKGEIKIYYSTLSGIIRRYFEEQFQVRAPEMTTEEFLHSLRTLRKLNDDQQDILKDFLNSCDMVKFAKYAPDLAEANRSWELGRKLICFSNLPGC